MKKLQREMRYIRGTKVLLLTPKADGLGSLKLWVDADFAVHHNMRTYTGSVIMSRKGSIYTTSTKHKLYTKNLVDAELVGINDVMTQVLWIHYLLEEQGYQ
eukprot:7723334-Ditylum_brightwellii.AAC.1